MLGSRSRLALNDPLVNIAIGFGRDRAEAVTGLETTPVTLGEPEIW